MRCWPRPSRPARTTTWPPRSTSLTCSAPATTSSGSREPGRDPVRSFSTPATSTRISAPSSRKSPPDPAGSVPVDAHVTHYHRALGRGLAGGVAAPALGVGERPAHRHIQQDRVAVIDALGPGRDPDPALAHAVELVPVEVPAD